MCKEEECEAPGGGCEGVRERGLSVAADTHSRGAGPPRCIVGHPARALWREFHGGLNCFWDSLGYVDVLVLWLLVVCFLVFGCVW